MRVLARGSLLVATGVVFACTLTHPLDDLSGGACRIDGVKDGRETAVDCGGGCSARCDLGQTCLVGTDCQTGTCVVLPGGASVCGCPADMVGVRPISTVPTSFCIDRTEVTNGGYARLPAACVAADSCPGTALPPECAGKKSFIPAGDCTALLGQDQRGDGYPVVCVDWCDAFSFCQRAGKRLCAPEKPREASTTEWVNACLDGSADNAYPYGAAYDPCRCNGADRALGGCANVPLPDDGGSPAAGVLPTGAATDCHGRAQIYDLSGNVWEWQAECETPGIPASNCTVRGGSFTSDADHLRCKAADSRPRGAGSPEVGFRCCSG